MAGWVYLERDGVRLACLDFGGAGLPVVLLHGLAGHTGEWAQTAGWLIERGHRVLAVDARGHGFSQRAPGDVSRSAHVADCVCAIRELALGRVVLVGQSLGGLTALLTAALHPGLVRGLVLAEAHPAGFGEDELGDLEATVEGVREWLAEWPVPFASRTAALEFFESLFGEALAAHAWCEGLEERDGGLWPQFEINVMARTLREAICRSYWHEWEQIRCPVLVVGAGAQESYIEPVTAARMLELKPEMKLVWLEGAKHDLHLDRPAEWREALTAFLDSLGADSG